MVLDLVQFFATLIVIIIVNVAINLYINPLIKKQKIQVENQVETVQKREKDIELLKKTFKDLEQEEEWNHIKDQI